MYFAPSFTLTPSKKFISGIVLMLLSVLMVAYAPMASVSMADTAADAARLEVLRQKALDEINRRIAKYEKTMAFLNIDVTIDKSDTSSTTGAKKSVIELPPKIQDQVKQFMQKIIDELDQIKDRVTNATTLTEMLGLGKNIDTQFNLDQLTDVQAMATQAIESMTGVFNSLQSAFSGVQSQVGQLKNCTSSDASASTEGCDGVTADSADVATQAQSQLDSLSSIMSTIASVLTSAISLLLTLVTTFTSMIGGLGGSGGLGNLGDLSSLTGLLSGAGGLGDLSSLTSSLGSITGLLGSFSAITSQLDITTHVRKWSQ